MHTILVVWVKGITLLLTRMDEVLQFVTARYVPVNKVHSRAIQPEILITRHLCTDQVAKLIFLLLYRHFVEAEVFNIHQRTFIVGQIQCIVSPQI